MARPCWHPVCHALSLSTLLQGAQAQAEAQDRTGTTLESIADAAAVFHFPVFCFGPVTSGRKGQPWSLTCSEGGWAGASCFCGEEEQREGQDSCCKHWQIPPVAATADRTPAVQEMAVPAVNSWR